MGIQMAIWGEAKNQIVLTVLQFALEYHVFYPKVQNMYSDGNLGGGKTQTLFNSFCNFH